MDDRPPEHIVLLQNSINHNYHLSSVSGYAEWGRPTAIDCFHSIQAPYPLCLWQLSICPHAWAAEWLQWKGVFHEAEYKYFAILLLLSPAYRLKLPCDFNPNKTTFSCLNDLLTWLKTVSIIFSLLNFWSVRVAETKIKSSMNKLFQTHREACRA